MAGATYAVGSFLGGEISQFAQGRFDKPDYRNSLKVCLNAFPVEIGAWVRRPGTAHGGIARSGGRARVMKYDFNQSEPITMEFTNGWLRFRNGTVLITTNDAQTVSSVSAANPAVIQTAAAHGWSTGNTVVLPGASTPLLENRQFLITIVDTTHFSIADAITGATIDGSTLGALVSGATVARVHELQTSYIAGSWSTVRSVQAETTNLLLNVGFAPQILTLSTPPTADANSQFALNSAIFNDGPYLDPFTNGALVTPSGQSGILTLTVSFPTYNSSQAYAAGVFVTSSSVNYVSLQDQNVGNTPASSPSFWAPTSASAAINNGQGFVSTDIGRLVRLFSEPAIWAVGTTYAAGVFVSYNPSGAPGASTYWISLVGSNIGNIPGNDTTHWAPAPNAALWTWGKITGLATQVPSAPSGVAYIGGMSNPSNAFNGNTSQSSASSAVQTFANQSSNSFFLDSFVGENFGGCSTTSYKIASATIFPSTNLGFCQITATGGPLNSYEAFFTVTAKLFGSNSPPANALNGTLLGTSLIGQALLDNQTPTQASVGAIAVTIASSNTTTSFQYIWVVIEVTVTNPNLVAFTIINTVAQVQLISAATTASSSAAINAEILGPPLLYNSAIQTWRLGAYSNTTGWPTCGCYAEGRIWLGGAIDNRFDACVSNGISGSSINFAPTASSGQVLDNSAISYTLNSDGVNPIFWMKPDLQGVLMGTQAGEWLVQAPTTGPITPTNIAARNVTSHGSANIQPCRTEHTTIFVQRFAQKLLEYFPDVFSGKFSAPNLADKAQHLTSAGVAEMAYTSAVTPIVWGRDLLGALFGITYKRDSLASSQPPTFYGWHRHSLGSGRVVDSICSGPSTGGNLDALTIVSNDTGSNIRHVEVLTDTPGELTPLASAWFLDDAVNPTSVSSTVSAFTINGLWHLNGKTVQVFAGGIDCGDPGEGKPFADFTVANGSITINYGDGISAGAGRGLFTQTFATALPLSQIVIGFTYNSDGQMVKPILPGDSGARNGPAFGKLTRAHRYAMKLVNTLGISIGGTFSLLKPANLRKTPAAPPPPLTAFYGISQDALQDDYFHDGGVCWRISRPFPANVAALGLNLETMDQ